MKTVEYRTSGARNRSHRTSTQRPAQRMRKSPAFHDFIDRERPSQALPELGDTTYNRLRLALPLRVAASIVHFAEFPGLGLVPEAAEVATGKRHHALTAIGYDSP